jgi:tripartite-type tricarboxylate transporter receptor subunit TctC
MKLGFDTNKDLVPVALIVVVPNVLVVSPTCPPQRARLIALVKANPEKFAMDPRASAARSTSPAKRSTLAAGTKAVHVPYKARRKRSPISWRADPARLRHDVVRHGVHQGRQGQGARSDEPQAHARTSRRADAFRSGSAGVEMTTWYGLFVTAGTPKPVIDKLYAETMKAIKDPDVAKKLVGLGGEPGNASQAEFTALVQERLRPLRKLIKDANVKWSTP